MVMATGIVSLAAHLVDLPSIAAALFGLNVAAFVVTWLLTALRAVWFPRELWRDLIDHERGPGYFASVAASGVLGAQFVVLADDFVIGGCLWIAALALWLALTYTIFTAFVVKERKPPLDRGISGAWLLAVVAAQSIAVLGAYLGAPPGRPYRLEIDFVALAAWLWGAMLYLWIIALIFYRWAFFKLSPSEMAPPYWINMGAAAISTLAGSLLIVNAAADPLLASLQPFLRGFTLFYWAVGTWWIPMLIALVVWRHVRARVPLQYDPLNWSAVFPLGMYAACTYEMARVLGVDFLHAVPRGFEYAALAAWALAFAGLLRAIVAAFLVHRRNQARGES